MLVLTLCIVCTECSFNFNWVRFLVVLLSMYKTFIAIYLTDQQHFEVSNIGFITAQSNILRYSLNEIGHSDQFVTWLPLVPNFRCTLFKINQPVFSHTILDGYPSIQTSHILRNICGNNSLNWGQFSSVFTVSILRAATGFRNNCNHNRQRTIILNSISVDYLQLLVDIRLYYNKHNLIIEWKSTNMHYVTDSLHKLRAVFESEFEFTYGHDM